MKLDKKIAVVTGGAMGNGLGIVKVFLKYGAKVIILDYDKRLQETIDILDNENVKGYSVDVSDKKKLLEIAKDVKNEYGNIDILVNNAGVCKLEPFDSISDELRDFHFNININGVWNTTKAFLPLMKNGGAIVNLSSVTGPMVADSGEVAYATTKSAILGFTKSLAAELASRGIRVNAIMPGYIRTPMVDKIAAMTNKDNHEKVINDIASAIPMKRLGLPSEVGELAAFLVSTEASYITAQGIVIDGGSTLPETLSVGI